MVLWENKKLSIRGIENGGIEEFGDFIEKWRGRVRPVNRVPTISISAGAKRIVTITRTGLV
jgi:hypothetical protein